MRPTHDIDRTETKTKTQTPHVIGTLPGRQWLFGAARDGIRALQNKYGSTHTKANNERQGIYMSVWVNEGIHEGDRV